MDDVAPDGTPIKLPTYEELVDKAKLSLVLPKKHPNATIYVVPRTIANVQRDAYRTREVSLSMLSGDIQGDQHASFHVQSILERNEGKTFDEYVHAMYEMQREIVACHSYALPIEFPITGVFSGCHVVDNLLNFYEGRLSTQVDQICSTGLQYLWVDYILVENQIPFIILQRIYDMVMTDRAPDQWPSLVDLCLIFFDQFLPIKRWRRPMESKPVHHLLHLVHHLLLPEPISRPINPPPQPQSSTSNMQKVIINPIFPIPSARRLQDAGIKFKKKEVDGFSEITFHGGVLEIPCLRIDVNTKFLLRNMIAWEQCHPGAGSYFTSYAIFMDYLINTEKDVEILNQSGIIEQSLGSEKAVAAIFNGLSTNILYNGNGNDFLPALCEDLNKFCSNKYNMWRAKLMTDYFSTPWASISVIAAIYLLIATSLQTYFTVYPYYHPAK